MIVIKRFVLLFLALPLFAQQPPEDPLARYLVPPDLIMAHSQELNLVEKQRAAIKAEVQKAQAKFIDLQWDMKEETEKMVRLLQQTPADETKILEQADKVMSMEREIKKTQLSLLIRIRNTLTAEQLAKLDEIRRKN
jgi:Spy/CpxP family protein refolding chaperone